MIAFDSYASPFIASERLILEPLSAGHAERLFASFSDPELYTYLPSDPPASLEAMQERYRRLERRRSTDGKALWLNWAARQESGTYVGVVEATVHPDASAHIAYFVFRPFQRQGFAAEAVKTVLAHLKNDVGIATAHALLDTRNVASWRLLERLGFKRERTITDADHFKGSASDEYEYVRHLCAAL